MFKYSFSYTNGRILSLVFHLLSFIYLLLTEFEGRTVSYGPSFYGPSAKPVGHKPRGNEVSKILYLYWRYMALYKCYKYNY